MDDSRDDPDFEYVKACEEEGDLESSSEEELPVHSVQENKRPKMEKNTKVHIHDGTKASTSRTVPLFTGLTKYALLHDNMSNQEDLVEHDVHNFENGDSLPHKELPVHGVQENKRPKMEKNTDVHIHDGTKASTSRTVPLFTGLTKYALLPDNMSNQEDLVEHDVHSFENGDSLLQKDGPTQPNVKEPIIISKKAAKDGCKNRYDKFHYCLFCEKKLSKIARHLLSVHKSHPRVLPISMLPKRSKERICMLQELENMGNFTHNVKVLQKKEGELVIYRRQSPAHKSQHDLTNYVPCEICLRFLFKGNLWAHRQKCKKMTVAESTEDDYDNSDDNECGNEDLKDIEPKMRNAVRQARTLLNSAVMRNEDDYLSKMVVRMQQDDITEIVRTDHVIRRYAGLRMASLGAEEVQKVNDVYRVSQGARTLARLVKEARKKKCQMTMNKLLTVDHFDLIVECVKTLTYEKERPSLTLGRFMGNLLGHALQSKRGIALRNRDDRSYEETKKFQELFGEEWNLRVNSSAVKLINKKKRSQVETIPLTEDLKNLTNFIKDKLRETTTDLQNSPSQANWKNVAKFSLVRLLLFNKRRVSEVAELKVEDFLNRPIWMQEEGEIEKSLSTTDRLLASR